MICWLSFMGNVNFAKDFRGYTSWNSKNHCTEYGIYGIMYSGCTIYWKLDEKGWNSTGKGYSSLIDITTGCFIPISDDYD